MSMSFLHKPFCFVRNNLKVIYTYSMLSYYSRLGHWNWNVNYVKTH